MLSLAEASSSGFLVFRVSVSSLCTFQLVWTCSCMLAVQTFVQQALLILFGSFLLSGSITFILLVRVSDLPT